MAFASPPLAKWISDKLNKIEHDVFEPYMYQTFLLGAQTLEFYFLPDSKLAVQRIRTLIRGAKKSIRVAMFTWTRLDFANDIVSAHLRGVKVDVVMDNNSSKGANLRS